MVMLGDSTPETRTPTSAYDPWDNHLDLSETAPEGCNIFDIAVDEAEVTAFAAFVTMREKEKEALEQIKALETALAETEKRFAESVVVRENLNEEMRRRQHDRIIKYMDCVENERRKRANVQQQKKSYTSDWLLQLFGCCCSSVADTEMLATTIHVDAFSGLSETYQDAFTASRNKTDACELIFSSAGMGRVRI